MIKQNINFLQINNPNPIPYLLSSSSLSNVEKGISNFGITSGFIPTPVSSISKCNNVYDFSVIFT